MGRLFWKIFFCIWLAQLTSIVGVGAFFWAAQQQRDQHWQSLHNVEHPPGPPPHAEPLDGDEAGPPPNGPGHGHHPPPQHFPVEPFIGGLLASVLFAALLARYLAGPIRHLRTAFQATAAGDLNVRVAASMAGRRDELADLGIGFDRMVDQLQAMVLTQQRLLHDVSHELRSPLARLQAAIGIAQQQPDKTATAMQRIEQESVRMDRLVGELLTLSRIESGAAQRVGEMVELADLLEPIVADAGFEGKLKDVTVTLRLNCSGVIEGDAGLLHSALENVVRNALKYTPPGSSVTIETAACGNGVLISVKDAGPGVPEGELSAIFDAFQRGHRACDQAGYGLGLAIARRAIGAAGGSIRGENLAGGGFCMQITLPVVASS